PGPQYVRADTYGADATVNAIQQLPVPANDNPPAYLSPRADGTGTASITVVAGKRVPFSLTLQSTIARITIQSTGSTLLLPGQSLRLSAVPTDVDGQPVTLAPIQLAWAATGGLTLSSQTGNAVVATAPSTPPSQGTVQQVTVRDLSGSVQSNPLLLNTVLPSF